MSHRQDPRDRSSFRNTLRGMVPMRAGVFVGALMTLAVVATGASGVEPEPTCQGLPATIVGTQADDVLTGTSGDDVIVGLAGNDVINGGLGDDVICGGPGDDLLQGQGGDDILAGNQGDDILDGGEGGCCVVATNTGDDLLFGGPGSDELHTSDFPTTGSELYGEEGDDRLFLWSGGLGSGGNGDDVIQQFSRDATLDGDNGDDYLVNWDDRGLRSEVVVLNGGRGDDQLVNEDPTGITSMDGGPGSDVCEAGTSSTGCEAL